MVTDTFAMPGMLVTDHVFELPLDHARPDGHSFSVFARELVAPEQRGKDLPVLLFLQGGPGSEAPRPDAASGWVNTTTVARPRLNTCSGERCR